MIKMNKKGFTLVELLGVITILGILMGVAVGAVSIYLKKSKNQAYENIELSAYDAVRNYMMENSILLNKGEKLRVTLDELTEQQYIENPQDPNKKGSNCTSADSYIEVKNETTANNSGLDDYKYYIHVVCPSGWRSKDGTVYPKK